MIHGITKNILEICETIDEKQTLTYDDGLYNQYVNIDKIIETNPNNKKIFFISLGIIHRNDKAQVNISDSAKAHAKFFKDDDTSAFMSYSQIKEISKKKNCVIGIHGFNHINPNSKKYMDISLKNRYYEYETEIDCIINATYYLMLDGIINKTVYYCRPYNSENAIFEGVLKRSFAEHGFKIIIVGSERLDIEK
jgi:peptidoglycan/xylan/chitin deacetylase (PgdA/CDA1 family)